MGKLFTPLNIGSGFNTTASLNGNFAAIEDAFDKTLARTGETPNQMEAQLDMNGYDIINAGDMIIDTIDVNHIIVNSRDIVTDIDNIQQNVTDSQQAAQDAQDAADAAEQAYNNLRFLEIQIETGDFTLDDSYTGKFVVVESTDSVTCTIAANTVGFQCIVIQGDTGAVTFTSSDTILSKLGMTTDGAGSHASVIKYTPANVYLNGQLV